VLAAGEIASSAVDTLGDTLGGIGSGIVWDPQTDRLIAVPDRGPGDGTLPFTPRFHFLDVSKSSSDPHVLDLRVAETVLLRDAQGRPFTGLLPDNEVDGVPMREGAVCLDPEAISLGPDQTVYLADEYGPFLYQFSRKGRMLRRIALPERFQPRGKSGKMVVEEGEKIVSGRDENRGPEGMCLLPDGKHVALIFQSALAQDGGRKGGTARILVLELSTGQPVAEYGYLFEQPESVFGAKTSHSFKDLSINDLVALSNHQFLVLERDRFGRDGSKKPKAARYKAVWMIDTRAATNLIGTGHAKLPGEEGFAPLSRESSIQFVSKKLLFDLVDIVNQMPDWDPSRLPAKWEGLALISSRTANPLVLYMAADNDFLTPELHFGGKSYSFPRAQDRVPTTIFEIEAERP
ncbi:MAG TPA: esterase-like activity of phytase family protein, partial [Terrimicrobiaceae bacterium]|nr:esterase-like activity of phytase family protein [Terrimicrobiaceae bacterium]